MSSSTISAPPAKKTPTPSKPQPAPNYFITALVIAVGVIASVVIGGTSLFGGVGTIFGTVVGSILIGVLINGLVLMNVNPYVQQITIGLILVAVVAFDQFAKSRRLK